MYAACTISNGSVATAGRDLPTAAVFTRARVEPATGLGQTVPPPCSRVCRRGERLGTPVLLWVHGSQRGTLCKARLIHQRTRPPCPARARAKGDVASTIPAAAGIETPRSKMGLPIPRE